jgi:hypothetical protein
MGNIANDLKFEALPSYQDVLKDLTKKKDKNLSNLK